MEDLNLKAMQRLWGRKVCDLGFGKFMQILEVVCKKRGVRLVKTGRFFPSSKMCYVCKHKNDSLSLRDRIWTCKNCGTEHDRDLNAAKNIEMVGTSTIGVEVVRLSSESKSR